jgi:protein SCO1/2
LKLGELRGQPRVLAMFFASCEYACPIIVHDLKRLEAALPEELRARASFVLVSFDTERDTPAALSAFRKRMELEAEQWRLLRGGADDVAEMAALLGVKYKQDSRGQFAHSNLITILNAEGEIVHQLAGLNQDVRATAQALERLLKPAAAHARPEPAAVVSR